jgi:MscS family membrane protein
MEWTELDKFLQGLNLASDAWRLGLSFIVFFMSLVARKIFDVRVSKKLHDLAQKTAFKYDDPVIEAIRPPTSAAFLLIGLFLALTILDLPKEPMNLDLFIGQSFKVALAIIAVWTFYRLSEVFAQFLGDKIGEQDEHLKIQFFPLFKKAFRIFVSVIGILLIIQNLGYSVGSLLAGLGIGGLAVALAAQETLANFFGSLVMLTDRPFKVNEWVKVGEVEGIVEELGFRSTRIRTWANSVITVPNKKLADAEIENWSAMSKRRVSQTLGLTYDTTNEKMQAFLEGVRKILSEHPEVDQSFHLVRFGGYGASSLDITVYYFTKPTDWGNHMRIKEENNLSFLGLAEKCGVSYAFPSRTLYWGPKEKPVS